MPNVRELAAAAPKVFSMTIALEIMWLPQVMSLRMSSKVMRYLIGMYCFRVMIKISLINLVITG